MFEKKLRKNRRSQTGNKRPDKNGKPSRRGIRDIVIAVAAILSLAATFMTLAGYGFLLAMEQFGLGHAFLFGSTLDLIDTSSWVVIFLFENIEELSFWDEYVQLSFNLAPGIAIGFVVLLLCLIYKRYSNRIGVSTSRIARWATWLRPTVDDHLVSAILKTGLFSVVVLVLFPALCVASMVLIIVASSSLLMAPYMGLSAGNLYISKYVVAPEQCEPTRSRAVRTQPAHSDRSKKREVYASCVEVRTERGLYAAGRVVIATTTSILLFDPMSGNVVRVPSRDAIIQSVDHLETKTPSLSFSTRGHFRTGATVNATVADGQKAAMATVSDVDLGN